MREFIGSRIDPGLLTQIDEAAKKEDRNRSDMIRLIIKRYFESEAVRESHKSLGGLRKDKEAV